MKKEFKFGLAIENNTEYFATKSEYHVYADDTTLVCDDRYVALRAHDAKQFNVFLFLKDKENVTLDFGGATLVMHGKIQPFVIDGCKNVTIKNCNITHERPSYTEALILEAKPNEYARLRLNKNCPCRIEDGKLVPYADTWENNRLNHKGFFFQVFDCETRNGCGLNLGVTGNDIELDPSWPFTPIHFIVEADGEDILMKGQVPGYYKPGRVLTIAHGDNARSISSIFAIDSKDIRIENYRILSGWAMGFYSYRVENITLDGFRLTHDEKSPCIISNAADAVHTFGTSGLFVIRNSIFEGMIDDAINIHANFRTVEHVEGNEIYSHLASCEPQASDLYRVGDQIAVYRGKTMEEVAKYTITKIELLDNYISKFTVDRPVEAHVDGDLIESLTANCDVLIENCIFGKANTHLRFQSRGKFVMKNCECELPILLSGDASYWFESGPLTDLTIENCRFMSDKANIRLASEVLPTEAEPYYHKNIKVINNSFDAADPIHGGYADGIVFKGNKNSAGKPMTLILTNCGDVDADNCTVERKTEVKDTLRLN